MIAERSDAVRFADAEPNGLADLLGRLIEANLERHPERRELLRRSVVEITASDADMNVTIRLDGGTVEIANGSANPRPHLWVVAHANDLLELAAVPLRLGLPDVFHASGRATLRRIVRREVRVFGMLRHPIRLSRLTRLLSVMT